MMERALDASVGKDCSALTAVDLACHQGWFALHLARRKFKSILAVGRARRAPRGRASSWPTSSACAR
jgi:hypothetical protein